MPTAPLAPAEVVPSPNPQSGTARLQMLPEDKPLTSIQASITAAPGKFPENVAAGHFNQQFDAYAIRPWESEVYFWDAPDYCHRPLYFQEVNLERYGYTHCRVLQPAISAAHFLGSTVALPYNMAVHPCHECIYPLGHYRPGSPVPYRAHWPGWRPGAASVEAASIVGLIFLIP